MNTPKPPRFERKQKSERPKEGEAERNDSGSDAAPGELLEGLEGEGDPGLSITGGSGHA